MATFERPQSLKEKNTYMKWDVLLSELSLAHEVGALAKNIWYLINWGSQRWDLEFKDVVGIADRGLKRREMLEGQCSLRNRS